MCNNILLKYSKVLYISPVYTSKVPVYHGGSKQDSSSPKQAYFRRFCLGNGLAYGGTGMLQNFRIGIL